MELISSQMEAENAIDKNRSRAVGLEGLYTGQWGSTQWVRRPRRGHKINMLHDTVVSLFEEFIPFFFFKRVVKQKAWKS